MPIKETAIEKQLRIKTGVCQRTYKEYLSYREEEKREQEVLEKMKSESTDEFMIRQQTNVVKESQMMIPDSKQRLRVALDELSNLIDSLEENEDMKDNQRFLEAKQAINSISID